MKDRSVRIIALTGVEHRAALRAYYKMPDDALVVFDAAGGATLEGEIRPPESDAGLRGSRRC